MKMKLKPKNRKWIIPTLVTLTSIGCISIGFCSWNVMGGVNSEASGDIRGETVEIYEHKIPDCFSFSSTISSFSYNADYGLLQSDGSFVKSSDETFTFSGSITFYIKKAYDEEALSEDNILLDFSIDASDNNSPVEISNYFTFTSFAITPENSLALTKYGEAYTKTDTDSSGENEIVTAIYYGQKFSYTVTDKSLTEATLNFVISFKLKDFSKFVPGAKYYFYITAEDKK